MPSAVSSKRSRLSAFNRDDDNTHDGVTIAEASSSLRNQSRKKARFSQAGPSKKSPWTPPDNDASEHDAPESDQDDVMVEAEAPPTPPPATQYEIMRDAGWKHLDHVEQDDQRATQRLRERPTLIGENHASLNAIIESITCINFMCHSKLHCELGPLLNFIVGENGSGKSAILTAITLCLGGKASATNRGGSLRSFVKEGQEHASLIVKIKNQGDDAYKPDLYGESITCERWFNKSGGSGFKLKSAAGRILSTKKADVDDVVEYYCLQVDNPLNVLSQDNARQFLNAAAPGSKYKYFVQGTQLEQLDQDYQLLTDLLDHNEAKLSDHQENIAYLKQKFEKAVKLRDTVAKSANMRAKRIVYRNQLAWAQVSEQEDELKRREEVIESIKQDITNIEQATAEKTAALDSIDGRILQAREGLEHIQQEEGQFQGQIDLAKEAFDTAKSKLTSLHTQERDMHSQFEKAAKDVKEYEEKVRHEEKRLEEVNGGALGAKREELERAEKAVEGVEDNMTTHRDGLEHLQNEQRESDGEAKEARERLEQKRKDVLAAQTRLRNLSQNRSDPWAGFEAQVPRLVQDIERDGGFRQKPIGPLGMHIQLTKPKWMPIIEAILGTALNGFIVGSRADQVKLSGLMDRHRIRHCPIYVEQGRINRLKEPDPSFDTILRVMNFDDPRVRDQLVINHLIDQTLLIENRKDAEDVMLVKNAPPPENASSCLCFHDKFRGEGLRIARRPGQVFNASTSPVRPRLDQKPRMKTDEDSQLEYHKGALEQARADCRDLEVSNKSAQQAASRAAEAVTQHKRQTKRLDSDLRSAQARVSRVQDELDNFDGVDTRLQTLKDDLQDLRNTKDIYGNQYGDLSLEKQKMSEEADGLKQKLSKIKQESKEHMARVAKAADKVKRHEDLRRISLAEKNKAHEQLDIAKVRKTQAESSRDRQIEIVDEWSEKARTVVDERAYIPDGETYASIERKFESIGEDLQRLRHQMGATEEEIHDRARMATQEYREAHSANKNLTSLVDELKTALVDRLVKYRNFQRHVSAHARTNFGYLLSERGFRGQLLLDHRSKKLDIHVEPDETRHTGQGRNTKTLSGGEKSFSSICLLLAIWDAMGSPLRCLDEFDVFMDNVNRAISTNMLITAARRSVGKQFILITPNAIEGRAQIDKDVKIIRLTDPRQTLLAPH
ncbi:P-loop containing nucleoside triphosphate hydrolase protein [Xylariaceae sp. FL0804]|nr:P-loop containing nucleoside triphosphate hydrolase protein [Xylariaceae sp. FL0804]